MATVLEASEAGSDDAPEGSEEAPDMSDKAQRRAQSRQASTSGRRPGEEFLRLGLDDRVTVWLPCCSTCYPISFIMHAACMPAAAGMLAWHASFHKETARSL